MLDEQLKTRIDFLKQLRIFKKASIEDLRDLAESLSDKVVHKDEKIICKGDEAKNMFIVARGRVKIHDGDYIYQEVGKGHVFGEYSLFNTHQRTASVTTLETTYLLKISQDEFKLLLEKNPAIQLSIIKSLVGTIAIQNELEKELAEKTKQIEKQKLELEKAIKTKDRFFSLLAHDLRSPLSTLSSYLNLLITSELLTREEIIDFAKKIQSSVENVVDMLDKLLNWAVTETGEWQMSPQNFNIDSSIEKASKLYREIANKKNITVDFSVGDNEVFADQNSIEVVIRNLLSNAIKYTPKNGSIIIKSETNNGDIMVSFKDNGVGMDKEVIDSLFSIDIKNKSKKRNNESGTGLGLILSKEFAEKNGGALHFESELEKGSTFYFTIPKAI
jgi:signal transduction histidine kinase